MASPGIEPERIQQLNERNVQRGDYVLYWMQQSQRAEYNHALEYAIQRANDLGQPCLAAFGLMDSYPEANLRHYSFMLEGLKETRETLAERGILLLVRFGNPFDIAMDLGRKASLIVCDRGYLRHQKAWREKVAEQAPCLVMQVESDITVPVEVVSNKAEYAARTIRPKIQRHMDSYLKEPAPTPLQKGSLGMPLDGVDLNDLPKILAQLEIDRTVSPVSPHFPGGAGAARRFFQEFLEHRFSRYAAHHNQPQTDDVSHMSPYLHFGQISPLYLALRARNAPNTSDESREAFLEELLVRRELAINFVHYNPDYDAFSGLPEWARQTLLDHAGDKREHLYTQSQLEGAATHDEYWNAAMEEMKITGYMHNSMRMYWGKKILEWSRTPEEAFLTALTLNNKYFLDGRDPNSYAGVAWILGLHDRPWKERPIYGKIRYMSASGLERKCDIRAYVQKVRKQVEKLSQNSAD